MSKQSIISAFQGTHDFQLDGFQIEAAEQLLEGRSVLVTAPTGSGKTIIAEFAIFDAMDRNLQVIYTTPLKALSNQKYRDLLGIYPEEQVGLVTGDISLKPQAGVVVMTTEILRNILYQNPKRLDSVLYIVIDECHYMNDIDRGTVWEEIIIHAPSHALLVALSATIANAQEMSAWISSIHNEMRVIEHSERPVPLEHYYYYDHRMSKVYNTKGKLNKQLIKLANKQKELRKKNRTLRRQGHKPQFKQLPAENKVVEALAKESMLPAIYFIFSRRNCDEALVHCFEAGLDLTTKDEKKAIQQEIQQLLENYPSLQSTGPSTENLLRGLPLGLASHHAGLVPTLRHLIEVLFQRNLVKIVFATETLAAGINMPARTTIISSLSKRTDVGHRTLTVNEFTQMTGRAGRRGKDEQGYAVILGNIHQTPYQACDLIEGEYDPIDSHFTLSYNMVLNLLRNADKKEVRLVLQRSFGQYLSNKESINLGLQLERKKLDLEQIQPSPESKSYIRHLRSQMRRIQKQIKRQQEIYLKEFEALTRVLQYFKRIKPVQKHWELTELGELTSHIRAQNDLLISLALEIIDFEPLSPVDIAVVFSTLVYEPRRFAKHDLSHCSKPAKQLFKDLMYLADDLRYVQEVENLNMPISIELGFASIVALWGQGCKWPTLFKYTDMSDGDVVRSMRQLIDLLRQFETLSMMPDSFRRKITEALYLIDRDLIQIVM